MKGGYVLPYGQTCVSSKPYKENKESTHVPYNEVARGQKHLSFHFLQINWSHYTHTLISNFPINLCWMHRLSDNICLYVS